MFMLLETPHAKLLPTTIELKPYNFFGIPFDIFLVIIKKN